MDSRTFDLPAAREFQRRRNREARVLTFGMGGTILLSGCLFLLEPRAPLELRLAIGAVFLSVGGFVASLGRRRGMFGRPPLVRPVPTRLVITHEEFRLQFEDEPDLVVRWDDPRFRLGMFEWPARRDRAERFTVRIGERHSFEVDRTAFRALEVAGAALRLRREEAGSDVASRFGFHRAVEYTQAADSPAPRIADQ